MRQRVDNQDKKDLTRSEYFETIHLYTLAIGRFCFTFCTCLTNTQSRLFSHLIKNNEENVLKVSKKRKFDKCTYQINQVVCGTELIINFTNC